FRHASPAMEERHGDVADSMGSLYHEATHAYFWDHRSNPRFSGPFERAAEYYARSILVNGGTPDDPGQLADEAASYNTDTRMNAWWTASVELTRVIHKDRRDKTVLREQAGKIRDAFERLTHERVSGFALQKRGWWPFTYKVRVETRAPIPKELAELI